MEDTIIDLTAPKPSVPPIAPGTVSPGSLPSVPNPAGPLGPPISTKFSDPASPVVTPKVLFEFDIKLAVSKFIFNFNHDTIVSMPEKLGQFYTFSHQGFTLALVLQSNGPGTQYSVAVNFGVKFRAFGHTYAQFNHSQIIPIPQGPQKLMSFNSNGVSVEIDFNEATTP